MSTAIKPGELSPLRELPADDLRGRIDLGRLPRHVAIIMDGNGRWAKARMLPRVAGHRAGAKAVRHTVTACAELGIEVLTLYAFSTENWKRPPSEVETLMNLLVEFLGKETRTLMKNNVRFRAIGRVEQMEQKVVRAVERTAEKTSLNSGLILNLALNYSGRSELIDAFRELASQVQVGGIGPSQIDEELISSKLYTASQPEPDLLIRTSGEFRVSNFLLWQLAYTEIHITDVFWPDFGKKDLYVALLDFQSRERRFGDVKPDR